MTSLFSIIFQWHYTECTKQRNISTGNLLDVHDDYSWRTIRLRVSYLCGCLRLLIDSDLSTNREVK